MIERGVEASYSNQQRTVHETWRDKFLRHFCHSITRLTPTAVLGRLVRMNRVIIRCINEDGTW